MEKVTSNRDLVLLKSDGVPGDLTSERALLGSVLIQNSIIASISSKVTEESFYNVKHQHIFKAMLELYQEGRAIDEVTLGQKLKEHGTLDKVGGYTYLADLIHYAPVNANSDEYARIVQNYSYMRKIMDITHEISRRSADPTEKIEQLLYDLEQKVASISGLKHEKELAPIDTVVTNVLDILAERAANFSELIGISSGYKDLDDITSGLQPADLIVLAARPSMGKTALALNIASHVALKQKETVFFFSLEMSKEQIAMRIMSTEAEINSKELRLGKLSSPQWESIAKVTKEISEAPFYISDVSSMSIIDIISLARAVAVNNPPKLIIIDYLQLIRSMNKNFNREQEIAEISRSLKSLARTLNVPVIAVSQLNRGPESRANKRPNMADIRESGAIEQDADLILFLYRDEVYNTNSLDKNIAELIISKHRNGEIGTVKLAFAPNFTRFGTLFRPRGPYEVVDDGQT